MRQRKPLAIDLLIAIATMTVLIAAAITVGVRTSSPDWFEAIGTWVGAIGTIGALMFAGLTLRSDLLQRRKSLESDILHSNRQIISAENLKKLFEVQADLNQDEGGGLSLSVFVAAAHELAEPLRVKVVLGKHEARGKSHSLIYDSADRNLTRLAPGQMIQFIPKPPSDDVDPEKLIVRLFVIYGRCLYGLDYGLPELLAQFRQVERS